MAGTDKKTGRKKTRGKKAGQDKRQTTAAANVEEHRKRLLKEAEAIDLLHWKEPANLPHPGTHVLAMLSDASIQRLWVLWQNKLALRKMDEIQLSRHSAHHPMFHQLYREIALSRKEEELAEQLLRERLIAHVQETWTRTWEDTPVEECEISICQYWRVAIRANMVRSVPTSTQPICSDQLIEGGVMK